MVIGDLDFDGVSRFPTETKPPLVVYPYAVLTLAVSPETLQLVAGRYPEGIKGGGGIEHVELCDRPVEEAGRKPCAFTFPKLSCFLVREGFDHPANVPYFRTDARKKAGFKALRQSPSFRKPPHQLDKPSRGGSEGGGEGELVVVFPGQQHRAGGDADGGAIHLEEEGGEIGILAEADDLRSEDFPEIRELHFGQRGGISGGEDEGFCVAHGLHAKDGFRSQIGRASCRERV